ncbi:MAG: TolC family protein, partial [Deltaproteobacteria bacterium]|nr:TolC family protein [Deltaproteobacteria bacterium]
MKKTAIMVSLIVLLSFRFSLAGELTLEQAVTMALKNSHELKINGLEKEKTEYLKKSALSQMGPKFGVQGKIVRWDQPTDNELGFEIPEQLKQSGIEFPTSLHVMDQTTADVSLVITQPLTPLYSLYKAYGVQSLNEESSGILLQVKTAEVRYKAAQSFFSLMRLLKSREIAEKSLEQVEAHYKRAMEFYRNGLVQKDDVLRAEVAMAKVKEALSQADAGIELAGSSLNLLMGMQLNNEIVPSGVYPDPPEVFSTGIDEILEEAAANRGEIKDLKLKVEMAEAGRLAMIGTLIPTVSAVFNLSRQWGNEFQRETSYFIGGMLQWNFWEWGTTYYQIRAADKDIEKAKEGG